MPQPKDKSDQHVINNAPLQWMNLTQRDDAKSQQYQRRVRAHVTRLQHRQIRDRSRSRQNALRKSSESGSSTPRGETPELCLRTTASLEVSPNFGMSIAVESASNLVGTDTAHQDFVDEENEEQQAIVHPNTAHSVTFSVPLEETLQKCPDSDLARSFSRGEAAYRIFALDDADNVVGRTVAALHLDFSSVMVSVHVRNRDSH